MRTPNSMPGRGRNSWVSRRPERRTRAALTSACVQGRRIRTGEPGRRRPGDRRGFRIWPMRGLVRTDRTVSRRLDRFAGSMSAWRPEHRAGPPALSERPAPRGCAPVMLQAWLESTTTRSFPARLRSASARWRSGTATAAGCSRARSGIRQSARPPGVRRPAAGLTSATPRPSRASARSSSSRISPGAGGALPPT
jgi:hypothetical protein